MANTIAGILLVVALGMCVVAFPFVLLRLSVCAGWFASVFYARIRRWLDPCGCKTRSYCPRIGNSVLGFAWVKREG